MAYTSTSKFLNILPYVLLEYQYTILPTPEEYPVNFGTVTIGFEKIFNGYYGINQILNRLQDVDLTGNTRQRSVVRISDNTFVDLGINYFIQYLDYDHKLTPTSEIQVTFPSNITVYYDTIKLHLLSGYNFPDIDGAIFEISYKENSGKNTTISQVIIDKNNSSILELNPSPIYYGGGIFDKYLTIKIPSLSNMCANFNSLAGNPLQAQTLGSILSTNGGGFIAGSPFTITSFEINTTAKVNGYNNYVTTKINTAVLNPTDEYSFLAANLIENTDRNYWEYYPTWQGEFIDQFIYTENSLGNIYYLINEIVVSEQIGLSLVETSRFQTIQNSGFSLPLVFRPIIMNSRATSFNIDYTISLINKTNNTSIVRRCSKTSYSVDLYGAGLNKIQLRNDPYPLKVYNKVVESTKVTSAYQINVNPINNIITKYIPAFFERENITISEQDITINRIGASNQLAGLNSTSVYGQGNLLIVVDPFDNYYKFKVFNSNPGAENTVLDLGTNSTYYLVFNGDNGNQIKVASLTDSTFQNPTKGELGFRVVEADSKTIQSYNNRDFHITSLSPNGIETSLYYGKWILPSERAIKNSQIVANSLNTGAIGVSGISSTTTGSSGTSATQGTSGTNANGLYYTTNENIRTTQINNSFDTRKDTLLQNIAPTNVAGTTSSGTAGSSNTSGSTQVIDSIALANSISGDEALNKYYQDIADYYTIPGRPGYNTFKGITKMIFLNAVKRIHPDVNDLPSTQYTQYASYLGFENRGTGGGKKI